MFLPFPCVRCPSCGSTFQTGTSVALPENGIPNTCPDTDQGQERGVFMPRSVLHSWKDIANYLGLGVRTAQRWEHDLGFPVHRPYQRERTAVLAFSDEIDEWLHRTPVGLQKKPAVVSSSKSTVHGRSRALQEQCA
jgi:hypothetical protein